MTVGDRIDEELDQIKHRLSIIERDIAMIKGLPTFDNTELHLVQRRLDKLKERLEAR